MKGCSFIFDHYLLNHKCHRINPNHTGSCTGSPGWIKNKKTTINPINKHDDNWFQYSATIVLDHEEIGKYLEILPKLRLF